MSTAIRPAAALLRTARYNAHLRHVSRRWQGTATNAAGWEDMLSRMEEEYPDPNQPKPRRATRGPKSITKKDRQIPDPDNVTLSQGAPLPDGSEPRRVRKPTWKSSEDRPKDERKSTSPRYNRRATRTTFEKPSAIETGHEHESNITELDEPTPLPPLSAVEGRDDGQTTHANFSPPAASPAAPPSEPFSPPSQNKSQAESWKPLETVPIKLSNLATGKEQTRHFDNIFLRDSCTCPQCVDESTRQKRFDTADIPSNIRIRSVNYSQDDVVIQWKHDLPNFGPDHVTRLSRRWLKRLMWSPPAREYVLGKTSWAGPTLHKRSIDFDYNEYMQDDKTLFELLRKLHAYGLVFIKNVPEKESAVVDTANRIGPLKNTFYGDTWDVRSISNAKNVAYTDVHLGFHMDLLYMQQPPRLQLLHCLRASTHGGESLFSDSYYAASRLHQLDPAAFETLSNVPANFHYDNDNHHYFQSRRTFQFRQGETVSSSEGEFNVGAKFEAVNWAPPFQAPFHSTEGNYALARDVRAWHRAAQLFRDLTELNNSVYKRQMKPGECVIFDNRRVLHARTAFWGGERWLRGAYLDDDPYHSKLRVLERRFGESFS